MKIGFLGATGTVTGSKYLVTAGSKKILVDCGLFQGLKNLRLKNWAPLPFDPKTIDAVILTHAHIDHSGYLPLFIKNGFSGKVYCTSGTRELCKILLPDSGYLQEEEARFLNKHKATKHRPALPLYTQMEAENCLSQFHPLDFDTDFDLGEGMHFRYLPAGHILGAAIIRLESHGTTIHFSGDLGRPDVLIMRPPRAISNTDYLVLESTYGDRRHDLRDPQEQLAEVINRTVKRGGIVIVPSFAVGRAQTLLYLIYLLKSRKAIPDIPVYLNSPMAADVTQLYFDYSREHRLTPEQCSAMCEVTKIVRSVEESKALNNKKEPMIVISASGMATGGRVLHHLKAFAPDPKNTVLFVGFQAAGTRGAAMVAGAEAIKMHGEYIPVRAEIVKIDSLSAHADYVEILDWLKHIERPPREIFITHGEPVAADALRHRIEEKLGWHCHVPEYLEEVQLR